MATLTVHQTMYSLIFRLPPYFDLTICQTIPHNCLTNILQWDLVYPDPIYLDTWLTEQPLLVHVIFKPDEARGFS